MTSDTDLPPGTIWVRDPYLAYPFAQVPIPLLERGDLSIGAKATYAILVWLQWRGETYPGHDEIHARFNIAPRSLRRYLNHLRDAQLLIIHRHGMGQPNSYELMPLLSSPPPTSNHPTQPAANMAVPAGQNGRQDVKTRVPDSNESAAPTPNDLADATPSHLAMRVIAHAPTDNPRSLATRFRKSHPHDGLTAVLTMEARMQDPDMPPLQRPGAYVNAVLTALSRHRAVTDTQRANPDLADLPHAAQLALRATALRRLVGGFLSSGRWDPDEVRNLLHRTWFRSTPPTAGEADAVEEAIAQAARR